MLAGMIRHARILNSGRMTPAQTRKMGTAVTPDNARRPCSTTLCTGMLASLLLAVALVCPRPANGAPVDARPLDAAEKTPLEQALKEFFEATPERQANWKFARDLDDLLARHETAVRELAWEALRSSASQQWLKTNLDAGQVRSGQYLSPFTVKKVGDPPANGRALFIAMHGGGGAPQEVNDSQWKVMQRYYKDHPEAGGYIYVALRAPNNTWNGFYDDYVYPLIANLIREFTFFEGVNPDKVFIMGYSHGGYGAFAVGPKMPDHFAAIHASASAPTDGETTAKTLRNTIFTVMVGEKDTDYGRIDRCRKFNQTIEELKAAHPGLYPVTVSVIAGNGHRGLPDRDLIKEMYPAVRNPVPRDLCWFMTDTVIKDFFWLRADQPAKGQEINATCFDNRITLTATNATSAAVYLDRRLADLSRPVEVVVNGKASTLTLHPSLLTLCQTMRDRGDPGLAFTVELPIKF